MAPGAAGRGGAATWSRPTSRSPWPRWCCWSAWRPVERAVFVLRESFDFEFAEIAEIVERSEDNCRQILSRARKRVADDRPRFDADPVERRTLAARFLAAAREGDLDGLVALLAPNAVLIGDGGGRARAIPRPMVGAAAVARAIAQFYGQSTRWA